MSGSKLNEFDAAVNVHQITWRKKNITDTEWGTQNGLEREWILPKKRWREGLWKGVRESLERYQKESGVQEHKGVHNLKSSWMLCANVYFPFHQDRDLIAGFLREHLGLKVASVDRLELEYAEEYPRDPFSLLNEPKGTRGANQTSPDLALLVALDDGRKGLMLVENKYVEHSFYPCAGRNKKTKNPNKDRCLDLNSVCHDPGKQCYMTHWEYKRRKNRAYWEHIKFSEKALQELKCCPAAYAGYQLFRQQALAEGIVQTASADGEKYGLVVSCVAYDERNATLMGSLRRTGIPDFRSGWGELFEGDTVFKTFSHQDWIQWVASHDETGKWRDWLTYVQERYGFE